jgi:hypothetical protein
MSIVNELYHKLFAMAERKQSFYITTNYLVKELIRTGYREDAFIAANTIYTALESHHNVKSDIEDCLIID